MPARLVPCSSLAILADQFRTITVRAALNPASDSISQIQRGRDINLPRHLLQDLSQLGFQRAMMALGSLLEPLDYAVVQPTYQDLTHQ
jgi:hypothetical protein